MVKLETKDVYIKIIRSNYIYLIKDMRKVRNDAPYMFPIINRPPVISGHAEERIVMANPNIQENLLQFTSGDSLRTNHINNLETGLILGRGTSTSSLIPTSTSFGGHALTMMEPSSLSKLAFSVDMTTKKSSVLSGFVLVAHVLVSQPTANGIPFTTPYSPIGTVSCIFEFVGEGTDSSCVNVITIPKLHLATGSRVVVMVKTEGQTDIDQLKNIDSLGISISIK